MPPIPVDVHHKGKPWPGYFLVRTTGEVVPLIAVDELPPSIELVGITRSLDLKETIGMLNLGLQRSTGSYYQIAQESANKTQVSEAVDKVKSSDIPNAPSSLPKSSRGSASSSTSTLVSTPKGPATSSVSRTIINSTTLPALTQLCRHWCTHGMCKWGQQCRYRHTMPMTLHGLQEAGLSDWPVWFRNQNPGYFVSDSSDGGVPGRIGRGRRVGGNAGACCGPVHVVNNGGVRSERLRGKGRVVLRERASGRVLRTEELGEQIIVRLRGMSKERKVAGEKKVIGSGGGGGGNAMIERAAARDTKNWEDETEDDPDDDDTDDEGDDKNAVANGKLVDV